MPKSIFGQIRQQRVDRADLVQLDDVQAAGRGDVAVLAARVVGQRQLGAGGALLLFEKRVQVAPAGEPMLGRRPRRRGTRAVYR